MNPYTRYLLEQSGRSDLEPLARAWDGLESMVIRVYRAGAASAGDEAEYAALGPTIRLHLAPWAEALEPAWRAATIDGEPAHRSPFEAILSRPSAAAFIGDWAAMQTLPAARQALNTLLQADPDPRTS